ncbi:TPA: fibrinogen-binding protein [Staphylococcus aureus]|nr:fibrinogen-binding protein [Staphylococcus aureus]HDG8588258.1 fibrinogen-binding protein [Staphylococcus aureus]
MKKNFIGKSILSLAAVSLTVSMFASESNAQTNVKNYDQYQINFQKQAYKKVVDAQKAVNLIHVENSYEKKKLQRQINLVLKYNTLK